MFLRCIATVAVVARLAAAAPAAPPPIDELLAAAGAAVVKNDAGAIVELRFKGPAVERSILAALPELPGLESLVVAGTDVDDKALEPIGQITTLRNLDQCGPGQPGRPRAAGGPEALWQIGGHHRR